MRIALLLHELRATAPGGVQVHVCGLARELARRGHQVLLLSGSEERAAGATTLTGELDALPVVRIVRRRRPGALMRFVASIVDTEVESLATAALRRFAPDVVHIHHLQNLSLGLASAVERVGIPVVATLHDHALFCQRLFLLKPDGGRCSGPGPGFRCGPCDRGQGWAGVAAAPLFAGRRLFANWVARRLRLAICPSRHLASFMTAHGVAAARTRVVPYGVAPPGRSRVPRRRGPVRFGFAATLRRHKGADLLLEAFARMGHAGTASLTLHGDLTCDAEYGRVLERRAREVGAVLLPPFPHDRLDDILTEFDCVVVPSVAVENSPILVRECLARKVPVVASRVGGLPESAAEGEGVTFVEPGDVQELAARMKALAEDPVGRLEPLAAACRSQPTLAGNVDELERIYAEARDPRAG